MSSMSKMLPLDRDDFARPATSPSEDAGGFTILEVLWRRRRTLIASLLLFVLAAVAYLIVAPRVYSSTAQVFIEPGGKVYTDRDSATQGEDFLYTQAEVVRSAAVLGPALNDVQYKKLKTFSSSSGDPVDWLRAYSGFNVEVGKKGNVLNVSMESPDPREAALVANAIVKSFVAEQARQGQATGGEMIKILRGEEADLQKQRDGILKQIESLKQGSNQLSFKDEKQNTALNHLAALSNSYTAAQLTTIDLRSELESARSVLGHPDQIPAYIEAMQTKSRDAGDKEYDEMRSSLSQLMLSTAANGALIGSNNPRLQALQADVEMLKKRIAGKEQSMVRARVQDLAVQLSAAADKEKQLKGALDAEQKSHLALVPQAETFAKLESDVERIQKQCDQIDARVSEVNANSAGAGALNVRILDSARPAAKAVRPNQALILLVAAFAGVLVGSTLCVVREWQDPRLRRPDEVLNSIGVPVIGIVPRIPHQLSAADRGQLIHIDPMSPAAEAYRTLRTAVNFGPVRDARTIAVVSPLPADGKSTTASNLAIALAEAGHRTLLIDGDLRRPVQHEIFGLKAAGGLSSVLSGEHKLRDAIHPTDVSGLYVLPSGPVPRNPAELIGGKQFQQVMEALGTAFERIVIDSPPLAPVADGRVVASIAHATIVVLRVNQSDRNISVSAVEGLKKVGANILGAVVNDVVLAQEYGNYYGTIDFSRGDAPRQVAAAPGPSNGHTRTIGAGARKGANGRARPASDLSYLLPEDHLSLGDSGRSSEGRLRLGVEG